MKIFDLLKARQTNKLYRFVSATKNLCLLQIQLVRRQTNLSDECMLCHSANVAL